MSHSPAPRLGYVPALDGLRGIAVLAVMLYHLYLPLPQGGYLGVDIFFVISGFLITGLLLEEWRASGRLDLPRFIARRALRLLPALAALLVVAAPFVAWPYVAGALLYATNYLAALGRLSYMGSPLAHLWSLAIEEQFYLLWPAVLGLLLRRLRPRALPVAIAIAIAAIAAWRAHLAGFASWERLHLATDTRADALLVGCLAAALAPHLAPLARRPAARALAGLSATALGLALLLVPRQWHPLDEWGLLALALASAVVVLWVARPGAGGPLRWRPLVATGRISYGLYLWHWPVYLALDACGLGHPLCKLGLAALVAVASYRYLEAPCLRLKERFRVARHAPGLAS